MSDMTPNECAQLVNELGTIKAAAEEAGMAYSTFRHRLSKADNPTGKNRVLIIGDTHCPVMLDGYVEFLQETFPVAQVTLGNHGALPWRRAEEVGIFPELLKDPAAMWDTPGWEWRPRYDDLEIDGVIYRHGDKAKGGQQAAFKNAMAEFRSVVQGHHHSQLGAWYHANSNIRVFGLQTGCGVDAHSAAMAYGIVYSAKPIVGCGVVLEGAEAHAVPMDLGSRYF